MTVPPSPGFPPDPRRQPLAYEPAQYDPRRLDSPIARLVCWTVITLCVAFLIVSQYLPQLRGKKSASGPGGQSTAMQQFQMEFAARYAVGTHALFHKMQGAGPDPSLQLVDALRAEATTAADRFEVAIVVGEIQGPAEALKELEKVRSSPPAGPATAVTTAPSIEPIPGTLPTTVPSGV